MTTTLTHLYQIYLKHPNVCTDTRKLEEGMLFFALKGDNFDGNQFAQKALNQGAAFAVIDDPDLAEKDRTLYVPDVLKALQDLAHHHRQQLNIPIIGITGSNGKTTTKELVSAVLSTHYPTHFTRGNFNNHIGVPLTLLAMPKQTEVAVIEMGANHQGEIKVLCEIAAPTHGLITNIGKAHLEGFGGIEGVKKGKSELYDYLAQHKGLAFVNQDAQFLEDLSSHVPKRVFYREGIPSEAHPYDIQLVLEKPFLRAGFKIEDSHLLMADSQLTGRYNFNNIMTAIALGRYFKVPAKKIQAAIQNYRPQNNRSQWIKRDGNTYLLDAYNANPSSMKEAIQFFAHHPAQQKVAVLGDMLELGEASAAEHSAIIDLVNKSSIDQLFVVGEEFSKVSLPTNAKHFAKVADLKEWISANPIINSHFLIKGSRGIRLEQLLKKEE